MKKSISFLWRYLPWHVLLLLVSLTTLGIYASLTLRSIYLDGITDNLTARSRLVGSIIYTDLIRRDFDRIESVCDSLGSILPGRFTIILPDGLVVGDSDESPSNMENHANRPEIIDAIEKGSGMSIRFSHTLKLSMVYVAVPQMANGDIIAIIRSSLPLTKLTATLNALYLQLTLVLICVILGAGLISYFISNLISRPISALIEGSRHFSKGALDYRIHISDPKELMVLGRAMNTMASELEKKITSIDEQQREMKSVLTGMSEALIAIEPEGQIIRFNKAAAILFETSEEAAVGKNLEEIVRNMDLLRFISAIRRNPYDDHHEAVISFSGDRFLQARGSILTGGKHHDSQILLVLSDITRLKRLENVRKEFVANVSHELKTPITAISAAVDTLIGGAVNDKKNSARFLSIISQQTARLYDIVKDLLQVSRLENFSNDVEQELETKPLLPFINEAIAISSPKAEKKGISLKIHCDAEITAMLHPPSLEKALINLLDNAIKYSHQDGKVIISCRSESDYTTITVTDFGEGIPSEHQERIFERFYRVDKSRSRKKGGTGLGLAIVKHAVLAQGGSVSVDSSPSKGSSFTISLRQKGK